MFGNCYANQDSSRRYAIEIYDTYMDQSRMVYDDSGFHARHRAWELKHRHNEITVTDQETGEIVVRYA